MFKRRRGNASTDYPQAVDGEPTVIELRRYPDRPGEVSGVYYHQCCGCRKKHSIHLAQSVPKTTKLRRVTLRLFGVDE